MSEWVETHIACPACPSSDAASVNDRGWLTCFSCGHKEKVNGDDRQFSLPDKPAAQNTGLVPVKCYRALSRRKISEETCRKFEYYIGEYHGETFQVANYRNQSGEISGQKLRGTDKQFLTTGNMKQVQLFGQHLWKGSGKKLVITEGEIDALSVSQIQGNKWPVVSLPKGAQGAVSAIKDNLDWVLGFEETILMFDMDDAGKDAARKVAELFPLGKCLIASLPMKDASEMLQAGKGSEVINAIWNAKPYRPDGVISIDEIMEEIGKPIEQGIPWCFPTLTRLTYGRRFGEIYAIGAGTGCGKTDVITQQIAFDVNKLDKSVGVIFLESKPVETGKRIAGKIDGKFYHLPDAQFDNKNLKRTLEGLKGKVTFYDNWGDTDWNIVKNKIRYMAVSLDIKLIYLDHLTAMADTSDEKSSIEQIMKEMASLANELNIIIHFVSHLSTPEGKAHEEGGRVMIKHFKGSRSIGFWSYYMLGIERNTQADNEEERQLTTLRILKDRYTGQATGQTIRLCYDRDTGVISEASEVCADYGFGQGDNTRDY